MKETKTKEDGMNNVLRASIESYVRKLQEHTNRYHAEKFPNLTPDTIKVSYGQTYARVYKDDGHSRSVHSFVALKDVNNREIKALAGDILMAAGWKKPAKHPRGSVYNTEQLQGVGVHGAKYLVGPNVAGLVE